MKPQYLLPILALLVLGGGAAVLHDRRHRPVLAPLAAAAALEAGSTRPAEAKPLLDGLRSDLALHRQLVVLFANEANLKGPAREAALGEGHRIFHDKRTLVFQLDRTLSALGAEPAPQRDSVAQALLDWMEKDPELLELDRLAFRDPLRVLQQALAGDLSPEGMALKARIHQDLTEVDRVEALVEAEYRQVYGGPGVPAKGGERERWLSYINALKGLLPRPRTPRAALPQTTQPSFREISGRELPDKVLVLTFDDGPHHVYTEEIKAILQQNQTPAVFFEVGRNLGSVDAAGAVKLGALARLTEDLARSGYVIGNHSYTHALLSKETGKPLAVEIGETDRLLGAIPGAHSHLFRFPYGARTALQLEALEGYHLRSVLWNIDSLDWADPIPSSVRDRVLRLVGEEKRGIILFHDIHDRAGKVLPGLVTALRAQGYRFGGLDGNGDLAK